MCRFLLKIWWIGLLFPLYGFGASSQKAAPSSVLQGVRYEVRGGRGELVLSFSAIPENPQFTALDEEPCRRFELLLEGTVSAPEVRWELAHAGGLAREHVRLKQTKNGLTVVLALPKRAASRFNMRARTESIHIAFIFTDPMPDALYEAAPVRADVDLGPQPPPKEQHKRKKHHGHKRHGSPQQQENEEMAAVDSQAERSTSTGLARTIATTSLLVLGAAGFGYTGYSIYKGKEAFSDFKAASQGSAEEAKAKKDTQRWENHTLYGLVGGATSLALAGLLYAILPGASDASARLSTTAPSLAVLPVLPLYDGSYGAMAVLHW